MIDRDHRVKCIACEHRRGGWCHNARRAGLTKKPENVQIGTDLATLAQDCPGYLPRPVRTAARTNTPTTA